ncbi:MAG TPA: CsbD family protein [Candidatus Kapabacteria bacterium]|nr:CsbD family protein [Candidatus Kapabacteria bacterium]
MKNSSMNQGKGKMREIKGRVKEGFGVMTNNPDLEGRGKGEKIAGKVQRKVGEIQQVLED